MRQSEIAEKILDYLNKVGKASGGQIKRRLNLSDEDFRLGKTALVEQGAALPGRGRGGTLSLAGGSSVVPPPAPSPHKARAANLKYAREVRRNKSREEKRRERLEEIAKEIGTREHPNAERIEAWVVNLEWGRVHIWPWYDGRAIVHEIWIDENEVE